MWGTITKAHQMDQNEYVIIALWSGTSGSFYALTFSCSFSRMDLRIATCMTVPLHIVPSCQRHTRLPHYEPLASAFSDMNPIEHIWDTLDWRVRVLQRQPQTYFSWSKLSRGSAGDHSTGTDSAFALIQEALMMHGSDPNRGGHML